VTIFGDPFSIINLKMSVISLKTYLYDPIKWGPAPKDFSISPDGHFLAVKAAKNGENIFVYDTQAKLIASFESPHAAERGITFWQDSYHLLVSAPGNDNPYDTERLIVWELGQSDAFAEVPYFVPAKRVRPVSSQNQIAIVISGNKIFCMNGIVSSTQEIEPDSVFYSQAQFSPNGKFVGIYGLYGPPNGSVLSLPKNSEWNEIALQTLWKGAESFLCFTHDSQGFITAGPSHFYIRELDDPQKFKEQNYALNAATGNASPDGQLLVFGGHEGAISLFGWQGQAYQLIQKIPNAHNDMVEMIRFSSDSHEIISADKNEIKIWQLERNRQPAVVNTVQVNGSVSGSVIVGNENKISK
jgi:WD40 repeat protein